jgi:uncharacterized protein YebE (UPF0316 family)
MPTSFWDWSGIPPLFIGLMIFTLRLCDMTLATLRMLSVIQGRRLVAWVLGFFQAVIYVTAVVGVLQNLASPLNLLAYAAGFASGSVTGITIEGRLAPGHSLLRITSPGRGLEVLGALRREGYGATELTGQGQAGIVTVILSNIPRRQVGGLVRRITAIDPQAFVTVEYVRPLAGGWHT